MKRFLKFLKFQKHEKNPLGRWATEVTDTVKERRSILANLDSCGCSETCANPQILKNLGIFGSAGGAGGAGGGGVGGVGGGGGSKKIGF